MSIRDISRAQAAYQEDWRDLYRRPLGLINDTNTAANNWRGVQQNLDTQHWRTQGINADNELRTANDVLKKQQMDGLRQFMDFQKRNGYDKNGQPVPFNEQVNTMRNDPNANGFAFQNLLATSPAAQVNAQAKSYQNAQASNNKWANGFIDTIMGMQQKDELGNPTGQIDKARAEQYAKLYGLANPSQRPFIYNVMQGLNAPAPQAVAPQQAQPQPQPQYVQPQVTQPVVGQLQNGVTTVPNGWQQGYVNAVPQTQTPQIDAAIAQAKERYRSQYSDDLLPHKMLYPMF